MERSEQLRRVVLELYRTIETGDMDGLGSMFSHESGAVMFGTDPHERWQGRDTILRVFRAQSEQLGGGLPLKAGDPQAFVEGSVGWVDDQPTFDFGEGQVMPARFTAVFHNEGGSWKLVQAHLSFGVSNQEVVGQELTT